nr:CMF_HP1_G0042530.mRNA.1.CDS.1 [Saccharomyces cerevisiae]
MATMPKAQTSKNYCVCDDLWVPYLFYISQNVYTTRILGEKKDDPYLKSSHRAVNNLEGKVLLLNLQTSSRTRELNT